MNKHCSMYDLNKISKSGQCFMINKVSDLTESYGFSSFRMYDYGVYSKSTAVDVYKDYHLNIHAFSESDEESWENYMSITSSDDNLYQSIYDKVTLSGDEFLIKCFKYGYGLRVLRQNPWQTLISFIISQQNNISKIKSTIDKICSENNSQFPSPSELNKFTDAQYSRCSLGYREKYIRKAADICSKDESLLDTLHSFKTDDLINKLIDTFPGVGIKVASCVALYAYNRLEVFPVDIWIERVLKSVYRCDANEYLENIIPIDLKPYAGVIQLYMYYYSINHKKEFL